MANQHEPEHDHAGSHHAVFPSALAGSKAWDDAGMLQSRRGGRRPIPFGMGFRSVRLNRVGFSALLGVGLLVGVAVRAVTRVPWVPSLVAGFGLAWAGALVEDRRRGRRRPLHPK